VCSHREKVECQKEQECPEERTGEDRVRGNTQRQQENRTTGEIIGSSK
jgi:hypothetical protein